MATGLAQWKEVLGEVDGARLSPIVYAWMNKPIRGKDAELPKTAEELLAEVRLVEEAGMSLGFFDDRALTEEQAAALATGAPPTQAVPDKFRRTPGQFNVLLRGFVDDDHYKEFLDMFRARGAVVKWYSGLLSPELLHQFDLYVELPVNVYTDAEAEAVVAFVKGGGCVFLMGGDYQNRCVEANVFLSTFDLTFTGGCGSPVFQKAADHPLTAGLARVHCLGGPGIEVKEPAVGLLKDGSTFGLACWEGEKGRIVVLCDEWPLASFGNDEENLHSPQYDHRRLAENLVAWLVKH
jgi:hypothetical protein